VSLRPWSTYEAARTGLTTALREDSTLAQLSADDESDWILALCDAWGSLAEVIGFYQRRIIDEAFLATAEQAASLQLIYHSLGHAFAPNVTATTTLAYHLSANVAGVEAVSRAGTAGGVGMSPQTVAQLSATAGAPVTDGSTGTAAAGTGATTSAIGAVPGLPSVGTPAGITAGDAPGTASAMSLGTASGIPGAAQVRAIPTSSGKAPVFVTLAPLGAYVGASRLSVNAQTTAPPPQLSTATTLLELAGTQTGLAVGQPVLITASPPAGGEPLRWIRLLTDVHTDSKRGSTRVGWGPALGSLPGEASPAGAANPVAYGFAKSSALVAAGAPDWAAQPIARQLQATTEQGDPVPIRGGFASSADAGATWTLNPAGLPPGVDLTAVGAYGEIAIVSAGASGLLRCAGGPPFTPTTVSGGSRRPVGFLGGSSARMLAGASGGVVYESIDQGLTWSAVTGGPPQLVPVPPVTPPALIPRTAANADAAASAPSASPSPTTQTVVSYQLPSTTVRCVLEDPDSPTGDPQALLAGTDAGLYAFSGEKWQAVPDLSAQPAVFDLRLRSDGSLAAATSAGVFVRTGGTWSTTSLDGIAGPVYRLAEAGGDLYAATAAGVSANIDGAWSPTGDGLPTDVAINAMLGDGSKLLVATDQGIYSALGTAPSLTWSRCDHAPAFTFPAAALPAAAVPAAGSAPGPGLIAAFADYGIGLDSAAVLTPSGPDYVLADAEHSYGLSPTDETEPAGGLWQVTLFDALPEASDLAQAPAGPVLAVGSAATSAANQWPGFEVAGSTVEVAPPVRGVAPGAPAIIEQSTASPSATVLDVNAVDQDSAVRAGRTTALTRLHFSQSLTAGEFPRPASTVWTGAAVLPLFDPPTPVVHTISGTAIELAAPLSAPVAPGQLVAITGSPPGLSIAPLGGAMRIAPSSTTPVNVGPPQADLTGVAIGADGTVYLAGAEGVFVVAPEDGITGAGVPRLLADGWPGGRSAGITVAGGTVLAASAHGVQRLMPAGAGTDPSWSPAGQDLAVVALAGDGTGAVASLSDGGLLLAADASQGPTSWTELPSLKPPAATLAISGSTVYAANASGVFALAGKSWTALGAEAVPGPDTSLQIDTKGTLWAGSAAGLQSYDRSTGKWQREPQVSGQVQALCLRPSGVMAVAGVHAVGEQQGTAWNAVATAPGATLAGMAGGSDGSIWLATRTSATLTPTSGTGELQFTHALVLTGCSVIPRDLEMLSQGAVPDTLLAALADAGEPLDPSHAVTTLQQTGCWLIRSGDDLYIPVQRSGAAGSTIDVYRNQTILYPTGPPTKPSTEAGDTENWTVLAAGTIATVTVRKPTVVLLPADAGAPAFGETASLAATTAESQAAPTTLGATCTISLQHGLVNIYDAGTMQVNLNVVTAAAGQPVSVPIGSGDPQQSHQTFTIPSPIAAIGPTADNPSAAPATTLSVYVNGQLWTAVPSLNQAGPDDPVYVQRQNTDGSATVSFGDGLHGAQLPAGQNNIVATYLQGGGPDTEAAPGALIQALDRPQLVTAVHNPAPALLPAMPPADQARLAAVRRLDRTITLEDYEDLVLAQAGVASARADVLAGPLGRALVITVSLGANAPDGSLDTLAVAVGPLSPSGLPVRIVAATPVSVQVSVQIVSAQPATGIEPAIRSVLGGLEARRPGDPLYAAAVLSAATAVPGVIAAQILGWERIYSATGTGTSLTAARASWAAHSAAPTGAELLTIDGTQHVLNIDVAVPPG
jgi:hypothetical protein